jgi:hypothetical protein
MRLPRMTTRRWMVAILIVGLTLGGIVGGVRLKRRRDYFLVRLEYHALMEQTAVDLERSVRERLADMEREDVEGGVRILRLGGSTDSVRRDIERVTRGIEHHSAMARKYHRAARHPWIAVEPDPPEPDWFPPNDP